MTDLLVGEVTAFRMFRVLGDTLTSYSQSYRWTAGANEATCSRAGRFRKTVTWKNGPAGELVKAPAGREAHGPIPSPVCGCGFWMYRTEWRAAQQLNLYRFPSRGSGFGDFDGEDVVLGQVQGWGRFIEGDDGYRTEIAKITALVTDDPDRLSFLLEAYEIIAIRPRSREEQGVTQGWVGPFTDSGDFKIQILTIGRQEANGWFLVKDDSDLILRLKHLSSQTAHVHAEFEVREGKRWLTSVTETSELDG